jgi:hypothetical protein
MSARPGAPPGNEAGAHHGEASAGQVERLGSGCDVFSFAHAAVTS